MPMGIATSTAPTWASVRRPYLRAGGFQPLESSEDVALVEALEFSGARIAWSAAPRVATSARREFRAPGGFGAALLRVETDGRPGAVPPTAAGMAVQC